MLSVKPTSAKAMEECGWMKLTVMEQKMIYIHVDQTDGECLTVDTLKISPLYVVYNGIKKIPRCRNSPCTQSFFLCVVGMGWGEMLQHVIAFHYY